MPEPAQAQIILEDEQYARLLAERRSGVGFGELLRPAVDRTYGTSGAVSVRAALDDTFGAWGGSREDGAAYVAGLRMGMAQRLVEPA